MSRARGLGGRWYGVFPALVTDIKDPDGQGRVKVTLPWSPDTGGARYEAWARVATLMGGKNRGSWFIPDVNDEVLVAFEGGDPAAALRPRWALERQRPAARIDGRRRQQLPQSHPLAQRRQGHARRQDGQEKLILETPGGQKVTMKDGPGAVEIVDSNGNSMKLETSGITVNAAAKVTINASQVEVSAGMVTVNAGMSKFSGVVQATP